ncbi:ATP-binding protein [Streptomyces galilaeus]
MNQETSGNPTQLATPDSPIRNFSVLLSPTPRGARLARLLATEQLRAWGLPLLRLEEAGHLVAELATNAATHGRVPGRDFRLTMYVVGGILRIEVTDTRGDRLPRPQPQPPSPDGEAGRGLLLVDALADRWGISPGPAPRKTIWAELNVVDKPTAVAKPTAVDRIAPTESQLAASRPAASRRTAPRSGTTPL